jgi:hypothetical protein
MLLRRFVAFVCLLVAPSLPPLAQAAGSAHPAVAGHCADGTNWDKC